MLDKGLIKASWCERYPRTFPKPDSSVAPVAGAVAVSRAGRDRFRVFIITDVLPQKPNEKAPRVTVIDGKLRTASAPKKKNLSHLILVGMSSAAAKLIAADELTDEAAREILEEYRGVQIS